MSNKKFVMNGFVRDENGKWDIVPFKLPETVKGDGNNKSSSIKKRRKFIPIKPLHNFPPTLDSPKSKRTKTEKVVRKELFRVPQENKSRLSLRTHVRRLSRGKHDNKPSNLKKHVIPDNSPLVNIEDAEKLLMGRPITLNSKLPKLIVTNCDQSNQEQISIDEGSENEFLQLERDIALKENLNVSQNESGITVNKLKNLIMEQRKLTQKLVFCQNNLEDLTMEHRKLTQKLVFCQNNLEECFNDFIAREGNKENENKRSNKLATKIEVTNTNITISPVISMKNDLRKSTLNKNLTKNMQLEIQSPKMKRAVDMYNCFRNDCTVLATPKLDRNAIENHQGSLSRKIQKQCLLLQDTPRQN